MTIYYEEYGVENDAVMMFIHGGGVSGWMWRKQVEYFQKEFHCLVPHLPEHGENNANEPFSMKASAEQLIQLLEEKASGRTIIAIGFSLGAQVLIQILSLQPHLIHYAMINSALVKPMPLLIKSIKPLLAMTYPLIKNKHFSKLQAKTQAIPSEDFHTYYQESNTIHLSSLTRILTENMSFTIPSTFPLASGNILITVGAKEKAIMKQSAKALLACHKQSEALVIPNIGHGFSFAMPQAFNKLICSWLNNEPLPYEKLKKQTRFN